MSNFLYPVASHWAGSAVDCRFKALADNAPLAPMQQTLPAFEIPNGMSELKLIATPTVPDYWEVEVTFAVSNTGDLRVTNSSDPFVKVRTASGSGSRGTVVLVRVSRFRDVTTLATAPFGTPNVLDQLRNPPTRRRIKDENTGVWGMKNVKEVDAHKTSYGDWPPPDWNLHAVPDAHFLDPQDPLSATGILNFAKVPALNIDADNVVLRSAGGTVPELFNVTWPRSIAPRADSGPTQFLVYFRQTNKGNKYDEIGLFVGGDLEKQPYPFNFDYADSGLFESLHYGKLPPPDDPTKQWLDPFEGPLFWPGAKGVPYQVARSSAPVVTVMPCGMFGTEYGILKDTEQLARILEEIQAFFFWRAGVAEPPTSIGRVALAAFSSGNRELRKWLEDDKNRKGNFLTKTLKAVYFLDPPGDVLGDCIAAALKWAEKATDPRIRLYSQLRRDEEKDLLGSKAALPAAPFIKPGLNNTRTVAVLPPATWSKTLTDLFKRKLTWGWSDVHHVIPGTMLTHALAQGDF